MKFGKVITRVTKLIGYTLIACVLLILLSSMIVRFIAPSLDHKRHYFETWASQALHLPVQVGSIHIGWQYFDPVLRFNKVNVLSDRNHRSIIKIKQVTISINVLQSLMHWRLLPGHLRVMGLHLSVKQMQGRGFKINGLSYTQFHLSGHSSASQLKNILQWLLMQTQITLSRVHVDFYRRDRTHLAFKNLSIKVRNGLLGHHVIGHVMLQQDEHSQPGKINFKLNITSLEMANKIFSAKAYVDAQDLSLKNDLDLKRFIAGGRVAHGLGHVQAWLKWRAGHLIKARGDVNAHNVALMFGDKQHHAMHLSNLRFHLKWLRQHQGWQLQLNKVRLIDQQLQWPEHQLTLITSQTHAHTQCYQLRMSYLRVQDIQRVVGMMESPNAKFESWLSKLKPAGTLHDFRIMACQSPQHWQLKRIAAEFSSLQWRHYHQLPAIKGLTGTLVWTAQQAELRLMSHSLMFDDPGLFLKPWQHLTIAAHVSWRRNQHGWVLAVAPDTKISDGNLNILGAFKFSKLLGQPMIVKAQGYFSMADISQFNRFVPSLHSHPVLSAWLRQAFQAGQVTQGQFDIDSPLHTLSHSASHGHLLIKMHVQNVQFRYAKHWPVMLKTTADLLFKNAGMWISHGQSSTVGNQLFHIQAHINNFHRASLVVTGDSHTQLKKGMAFLMSSPLKFARHLSDWRVNGPVHVALRIGVKFVKPRAKVNAQGVIQLKNNQLQLPAWQTTLNDLQGSLKFNNSQLLANGIHGFYLGQPFKMVLNTVFSHHQPIYNFMLGGRIDAVRLAQHDQLPLRDHLNGVTSFRGLLTVSTLKNFVTKLSIVSDLLGVKLDLPKPFAKLAKDRRHFHYHLMIRPHQLTALQVDYANILSIAAKIKKAQHQFNLINVHFHLGPGQATFQKLPGMVIDGQLGTVNVNDWQSFFAQSHHNKVRSFTSAITSWLANVRKIRLVVQQLKMYGQTFHQVHVLLVSRRQGWHVTWQSKVLQAVLNIPRTVRGLWQAHLSRLVIQSQLSHRLEKQVVFTGWPAVQMTVDDLVIGGLDYGKVALATRHIKQGLKLRYLHARSPLFGLNMSGQLTLHHGRYTTQIHGDLGTRDLGSLLRYWHVTAVVLNSYGHLTYRLSWPGSFYPVNVSHMKGQLDFHFNDGRIIHLSKTAESQLGLGRVLNLLSMQSLPKTLLTGFTSLKQKGFAVNLLKGQVFLDNGRARINHLLLVGPEAWVKIKGFIGLLKKTYHLDMEVTPNVTSSLPLIATLTGGPLAGAVTWLANKLIAARLVGHVAQSAYQITGTWEKPVIRKVIKNDYLRR